MATTTHTPPIAPPSMARRISTFFWRNPRLSFLLLLLPPMLWLVVFYLGSLASMLLQRFYSVDDNAVLVRELSLRTYQDLLPAANIDVMIRTATMAGLVNNAFALIGCSLFYLIAPHA